MYYNYEAENALIGCILVDGDMLPKVLYLQPADFFSEFARDVWMAILACKQEGYGIDQITVGYQLAKATAKPRIELLSRCVARCPTSLHASYYARIIKELSLQRQQLNKLAQPIKTRGIKL